MFRVLSFLRAWPLAPVLLLALAYFMAGRLALLLAIPPGFATAIFPPLGISLAALLLWGNRLLLGVFLGSLCLNLSIAISNGAQLDFAHIQVAGEIALGSCLAAWVGASLIRRFSGFPNDLTDEWSIFSFFILGGPIASCISALVGVSALVVNGVVPRSDFLYSLMTWWTGDTIGVLIATPFMFIFYAKPRFLWRGRLTSVGIPLVVSCFLIVVIFFTSSASEQQKIQRAFQNNAQTVGNSLFEEFDKHIRALIPLKGLYLTSGRVAREDFRLFTNGLLDGVDTITALSWDARVKNIDRDSFEKGIINEGYSHFFISERDKNNQLIPAKTRDQYVVVTYIEPYLKNNKAHGFDIASDVIRERTLAHANSTGLATMSDPLSLVQEDKAQYSYLIFMPVYETSETPATPVLRDKLLRGYVTALFSVNDEIKKIYKGLSNASFQLNLVDVTNPQLPVNLYKDTQSIKSLYADSFLWEEIHNVAGRELKVSILPTERFINENRGMQAWYVLVGGLLFCSLLGGFLLLVTGRAQHVALLVEQRTLELAAILNEAVEAIIICDEFWRIERANPAACNLFEYTENKLIGTYAESVIPVLNDIKGAAVAEKGIKSIDAREWKSLETLALSSSGMKIPIEIGVSCVELPERRIYTCIIHDVTARKKIDKLKSEFISTVSHELRTPLTSITGALGLLTSGSIPEMPAKAMDLLAIAKSNALRLGRLVNDILDIEKLEFGQLQLELIDYEVNDLMRVAIEQNSGYAVKYGVHLALDNHHIDNQKIIVRVDPDRFLQVMSNLISNAVKYSNLDGIVTLSAKVDGSSVLFSVEDHGSGIPEVFRSRIFQKFAQADSSDTRRREGTGLGLSITRIIVERMGGVIDYTSSPNKGSVFYFSLPVIKK